MGHPFKKYSNLILFYETGSGTFTRDPDTGNWIEDNPVKNFIICSVTANLLPDTYKEYAGTNPSSQFLEGYLVKPKLFPSGIKTLQRLEAKLIDAAKITKPLVSMSLAEIEALEGDNGYLLINQKPQSRFKSVTKVLGNQISGNFSQN